MFWKPNKSLGMAAGLTMVVALVAIAVFLFRQIVALRPSPDWYFVVLLFGVDLLALSAWAYRYYSLLTLRYYLDRDALVIEAGGIRHQVPMDSITEIVPGDQVTVDQRFRGIGWPGYLMGRMHLEELGTLLVRSTEPLGHQLVVVTDSLCYGISPRDPAEFLEDYASKRALEPLHQVEPGVEYAPFLALTVWRDYWLWRIIVLAFVASTALLGLVAAKYGGLPERIPVQLGSQGEASRFISRDNLLALPMMGGMSLVANSLLGVLLHQRERLSAYLLAVMSLSVQVILWLAVMSILAQ